MIQHPVRQFQQMALPAINQPKASPSAIQFKGIHPDAIAGGDIKLVDMQRYSGNQNKLFQMVKPQMNFSRLNKAQPLLLELESSTGQAERIVVKAPVGNNKVGVKIGYLPDTLAKGLAPHFKKDLPFAAWLMGIRRHPSVSGAFDMKIRLESLNEAGKAPNLKVRDSVVNAFTAARAVNTPDEKGFQQVLTIIPEKINTFQSGDTNVTERCNQEQGKFGESTFFVNGSEVFRTVIDPSQNVKLPQALQDTLNESAALWITQQVNLERVFPGDGFNQFA